MSQQPQPPSTGAEILVMKHGALGDIILCTGPLAAIRAAHPQARITLLTTKPYDRLLSDCPFVDAIITDTRPKLWHMGRFRTLIKQLQSHQWEWVYDLQTSGRSTSYFRFLNTRHYSGLHLKGSHPHNTPERTTLHTIDRQKQQLEIAGIADVPAPSIAWLEADVSNIKPATPYALLVAGGSAHRPEKRWPAEHYAALAQALLADGITPVLLGTKAEEEILNQIEDTCHPVSARGAAQDLNSAQPQSGSQNDGLKLINLCNQTSFAQIASLARGARFAVGNDTGPMHIIAATGCQSTVLFNTTASNPALCAPRGAHVNIIAQDDLSTLTAEALRTQTAMAS